MNSEFTVKTGGQGLYEVTDQVHQAVRATL